MPYYYNVFDTNRQGLSSLYVSDADIPNLGNWVTNTRDVATGLHVDVRVDRDPWCSGYR